MTSTVKRERLHLLDEIRGLLIIGVVFSHALFDLRTIFGVYQPWMDWPIIKVISDAGAIMFILISGMVSKYSSDNIARGYKLLAVSLGLTVVTMYAMPDFIVYLGILHFLAFSIILVELLSPILKKINSIAAISLFLVLSVLTWDIYERYIGIFGFHLINIPDNILDGGLSYIFGLKIINIIASADYYPILPWICFFFIGFYLIEYIEKEPIKSFVSKSRCVFLSKTGRVSLWIYLIHQPVLYALFYLLNR